MQHILEPLDDGYCFQIASEEDHTNQPLHDDLNWSTVDTDAPYHLCSVCELPVYTTTANLSEKWNRMHSSGFQYTCYREYHYLVGS